MILIHAVLDTNVVASGILRFESASTAPAIILHQWLTGHCIVSSSTPLREELARTLASPYFAARISPDVARQWQKAMVVLAKDVPLAVSVSEIATHPEDDLVLATAASARADYLVTGDRQLLRLGSFEGVSIISPANFVRLLDEQDAGESSHAIR